MAITQEKDIQMLEKLPDGNFKIKYPETKARNVKFADGSTVESHKADYVRQPGYGTTGGSANTYTLALNPALAAYVAGVCVAVKIHVANTGASTININGLGAKSIRDSKGNALTAGKLILNGVYTLRYDGTNFILQGEGGSGNALASDLLSGKTASVDAGDIIGTMPNRGTFSLGLGASVPVGYYSGGSVPSGKKFSSNSSIGNNTNSFTVSGLAFAPKYIFLYSGSSGMYGYGVADLIIVYNNGLSLENGVNSQSRQPTITTNSSGFTITRNTSAGTFSQYDTYNWVVLGD